MAILVAPSGTPLNLRDELERLRGVVEDMEVLARGLHPGHAVLAGAPLGQRVPVARVGGAPGLPLEHALRTGQGVHGQVGVAQAAVGRRGPRELLGGLGGDEGVRPWLAVGLICGFLEKVVAGGGAGAVGQSGG